MVFSIIIFGILWVLWIGCTIGIRDIMEFSSSRAAIVDKNDKFIDKWPEFFSTESEKTVIKILIVILIGLHILFWKQVADFSLWVLKLIWDGVFVSLIEWIFSSNSACVIMLLAVLPFMVAFCLTGLLFVLLPPYFIYLLGSTPTLILNYKTRKQLRKKLCPACNQGAKVIKHEEKAIGGWADSDTQSGVVELLISTTYECTNCETRWIISCNVSKDV